MKALFPLALLALAGCNQAPAQAPVDSRHEQNVKILLDMGWSREDAEELASRAEAELDSPEIAYRAEQRQKEIQEINDKACEQAPYLDHC